MVEECVLLNAKTIRGKEKTTGHDRREGRTPEKRKGKCPAVPYNKGISRKKNGAPAPKNPKFTLVKRRHEW